MPKSSHPTEAARCVLLSQIADITTMLPGTLAEEWRQRPSKDGEATERVGPYFKHQVWKDGRNVSRRVPADQAAQLREDIDNAKRFEQLTTQLANLNFEHTLALRAATDSAGHHVESKKTSRRRCPRKVCRNPSFPLQSQNDPEFRRSRRELRMDRTGAA